jgi:tetratricopeptide (TPR) repeat protein
MMLQSGAVDNKSSLPSHIRGHIRATIAYLDRSGTARRIAPIMRCSPRQPRRRTGLPRLLALGVLVLLVMSVVPARAQSDAATDDRVQQLYAEAKDAEARGDFAGGVQKYQAILKIAPRLGPAYNNLGALYVKQGDYQKAADILEQGLKVDPKMTSAAALLGIVRYEMGDYPAARKRLEAVLRANPKDTNIELYLANTLVKTGDLEPAARHLEQVTQREPKNQEAWYRLGKVYVQLAERAIVKVNEIDPKSVVVHELSGEIMESMDNYDGALLEYKKAVEMAPQRPGTHLRLGNAYWALRMWEPATEQFHAELQNDPKNCEAQWKLGNIQIEQQSGFEEALANTEKALAMCPDLKQAHVDRGRALLKLGRNEEAVKDLKIAEEADPSVSSTHFLLAQAYRALGKTQEARTEMQLFSKLEENARAASSARAHEILQNAQHPN